jgi:hypothetical protein
MSYDIADCKSQQHSNHAQTNNMDELHSRYAQLKPQLKPQWYALGKVITNSPTLDNVIHQHLSALSIEGEN